MDLQKKWDGVWKMKFIQQYKNLSKEIYILFFGRVVTSMGSLIWPLLTLILKNVYLGLLIPLMTHKADCYAEEGNYKGVEHMHLLAGFGLSLMLGLIVTISYMVGSNTIGSLLEKIPDFVQNGLTVATGLIPALGFAMLARLLINKKVVPYFFLGFALASYLKIPVTGIAIFGAILAVVVVNIMNVQKTAVQTSAGEVEEDEDF